VLQVGAGEAAQDVCRGCGAEPERGRIADHLVILLGDQHPVDRAREDRLQGRVGIGRSCHGPKKALAMDAFQPRQELETEKLAEAKGDLALPVTVHVCAIHRHVGAVAQNALDHGGGLGRGDGLELRVDAQRLPLDMPINHDIPPAIAGVPLRHQVLVPRPELLAIGGARRGALTPDAGMAGAQRRVHDSGDGFAQGIPRDDRRRT